MLSIRLQAFHLPRSDVQLIFGFLVLVPHDHQDSSGNDAHHVAENPQEQASKLLVGHQRQVEWLLHLGVGLVKQAAAEGYDRPQQGVRYDNQPQEQHPEPVM